MITKPMLACNEVIDLTKVTLPIMATVKFDGIRLEVIKGKALSRSFKAIPNDHIRETVEAAFPDHKYDIDGEVMVAGMSFNDLSGAVRRKSGRPDFYYAVFDIVDIDLKEPYWSRMHKLDKLGLPSFCKKICPRTFSDVQNILRYNDEALADGYEGLILRSPNSPYKCGRSTLNEGYMLKLKAFEDAEATIIGFEEETENQNVATRDAFGRSERSSHKENLVPKGTLGAFICSSAGWPKTFKIGTGFDAAQRLEYWIKQDLLFGKLVKFKFQAPPVGGAQEDRPRIPVFLGFRDAFDM